MSKKGNEIKRHSHFHKKQRKKAGVKVILYKLERSGMIPCIRLGDAY